MVGVVDEDGSVVGTFELVGVLDDDGSVVGIFELVGDVEDDGSIVGIFEIVGVFDDDGSVVGIFEIVGVVVVVNDGETEEKGTDVRTKFLGSVNVGDGDEASTGDGVILVGLSVENVVVVVGVFVKVIDDGESDGILIGTLVAEVKVGDEEGD